MGKRAREVCSIHVQPFVDRTDAGQQLAAALDDFANEPNLLVLALPRGGVPVAYEVARHLQAPLDVYVVRKLGVPGHEELAMGALASDGTCVVDDALIESLGIEETAVEEVIDREIGELRRRHAVYRDACPQVEVSRKTVILVDDGLATGATMRVAVTSLRRRGPLAIVVGVPVAAPRTCAMLEHFADRVICVKTPEPFHAVGLYYQNFEQTTDDEVRRLLGRAGAGEQGGASPRSIEAL